MLLFFQGVDVVPLVIYFQGVASLALRYVLVWLSARTSKLREAPVYYAAMKGLIIHVFYG